MRATLHQLLPAVLALAVLAPARAAAQRVELGAATGLTLPPVSQFERSPWYAPSTPALVGRTEPGWRFALHARFWMRRQVGVEGLVSRWSPKRTVALVSDPPGTGQHGATTLTSFAVRAAWRFGDLRHRHGELALGPALTHLAGEGYSSDEFGQFRLSRRSEWGVSAAAAVVIPANRRIAVRGGADVFTYRVHMAPVQQMIDRAPLQLEWFFNLGVFARVR